MAIVGGGGLSGLYGVNGGLVDAQGTGLQHAFLGDYRHDLIHTATTLILHSDGAVEYGDRLEDPATHPVHLRPESVFNRSGFAFGATFGSARIPGLRRTELVYAPGKRRLTFDLTLRNAGDQAVGVEAYALVIFRGHAGARARLVPAAGGAALGALWSGPAGKEMGVALEGGSDRALLIPDSPSGFLYRTIQALCGGEPELDEVSCDQPIGLLLGRHATVPAGGEARLRWHLIGGAPASVVAELAQGHTDAWLEAESHWETWFREGVDLPLRDPALLHYYRANLAAVRAAVMDGFVPADLTGQYFAGGTPSYYARDSMMIARSLLLSGHVPEFEAVVRYLAGRTVKRGGEFCQRYDAAGRPSEGQHNGVPHQLDSQGYFVRNVIDHARRTGRWLVGLDELAPFLDVLAECIGPTGMVGPEGGVNEGVYGPAFITSTNLCISGGLRGAIEDAEKAGLTDLATRWRTLREGIEGGIQSAWDSELDRYHYGFVTYAETPVRRYDAPQYFGPLYGYPLGEQILANDRYLRRHATFFGEGIGYSEQAYHHGPWIFNTAACAEFLALTGQWDEYEAKVHWLVAHSNQYGLMPEAIDADDEGRCYVNPLVWGCAETAAALAILATRDGHLPGRLPGAERFLFSDPERGGAA